MPRRDRVEQGRDARPGSRRLPILGDVRMDRKLRLIVAVFLVLIGVLVGYNAIATSHERDATLIVNIAARQRALAERYIKDLLLKADGQAADPLEDAVTLQSTADALLRGGQVKPVQGDEELITIPLYHGDPDVIAKLRQEQRLLSKLVKLGDQLLSAGRASPNYEAEVLEIRVVGAQLATISDDAVGEMTKASEDALDGVVRLGIILGLIGALAALAMGSLLRRAGAQQAAQFRSLVHNASDLITVLSGEGRIRYQSGSVERVLGRRASDLVGTRLSRLIHPDDVDHARAVVRQIVGNPGEIAKLEYRIRHADGSWRYMESTLTNLIKDPTVAGLILNTRDITDRKMLEEQLSHQAFHDSLTGLANRALFRDRLEHALARVKRSNSALAVLFLDLDNFKNINDSLGHDHGDELLMAVAGRLLSRSRASDTVARLGGDEFAVLLEDEVDEASAAVVADRIADVMRSPFSIQGTEVFVTASIGIALGRGDGATVSGDADALLRNADVAMYAAKAKSRGLYQVFEPAMHDLLIQHLELQADLQRGLERNEFFLTYQPILDLVSGRLLSVEALIRWNHPTRGVVMPADFIPAAEETGAIVRIGAWVLRQACVQAKAWQTAYPMDPPLAISVNLSPRQLREADLADQVSAILGDTGLDPGTLVLEITETGLMQDVERAVEMLRELKGLGVRLAIDDFGTGSSSLGSLRRLPIDVLKIDRSFVETMAVNAAQGQALVRAIVDLAQTLQLETVAEGIEVPTQMARLQAIGCRAGQGFYFAEPLDPSEMEAVVGLASRGGPIKRSMETAS